MDWLNELLPATGIDKVVGEMAKRLLEGPVIFRCPFFDGNIEIVNLNDYLSWVRFARRMDNDKGAEINALHIWNIEKQESYY